MASTPALRWFDAAAVDRILPPAGAVAAIVAVLRDGFDPADDPPRTHVEVRAGQVLLMPSDVGDSTGVKVVTVAPGNDEVGRPRIQGLYLLTEAATLTPVAVIDGAALTTLRTPAVSLAAVGPALLGRDGPVEVVIFGAGPQGRGHARTLSAVLDGRRPISGTTWVVRRPDRHADLAAPADGRSSVVSAGDGDAVAAAVARADVVVTATTAASPLFDGALVRADAVVMAVGSHQPRARELDGALLGRATVVVESTATALREGGDVIQALAERALTEADLVTIREVATGAVHLPADRPVVFKGSGMSWQDLAVARALLTASG